MKKFLFGLFVTFFSIVIFYQNSDTYRLITNKKIERDSYLSRRYLEQNNRERIRKGRYSLSEYTRKYAIFTNIDTKQDLKIELDLGQWNHLEEYRSLSSDINFILVDNILYAKSIELSKEQEVELKDNTIKASYNNLGKLDYYIHTILLPEDSLFLVEEHWQQIENGNYYKEFNVINQREDEFKIIYEVYQNIGEFGK